ncbi:hypothetical protein A6R68_20467 [Neotoma lepida]|uniref:Uncharacterized protein n=1 Tax=Neotoma lepida TaxID=56216 RepID=A0A1A6HTP6_NEOLE|nr:hypothetical protein A6R68_20467 [Neotoma lepida]
MKSDDTCRGWQHQSSHSSVGRLPREGGELGQPQEVSRRQAAREQRPPWEGASAALQEQTDMNTSQESKGTRHQRPSLEEKHDECEESEESPLGENQIACKEQKAYEPRKNTRINKRSSLNISKIQERDATMATSVGKCGDERHLPRIPTNCTAELYPSASARRPRSGLGAGIISSISAAHSL